MASLLKSKQIDINDVINAIEFIFQNNEDVLNQFLEIISGGDGLNNKVQTSSQDPNAPGYLVDKLLAQNEDSGIHTSVELTDDKSKVQIESTLNYEFIANSVLSNIKKIFFVASAPQSVYVDVTNLLNSVILIITREGREIYEGTAPDEYQYDPDSATVTFNSALGVGERIKLLCCSQGDVTQQDMQSLQNQIQDIADQVGLPIVNTYTTDSSFTIPENNLLEKIVVLPSVDLAAFGVGYSQGVNDIIYPSPIEENGVQVDLMNIYAIGAGKTIWFNGITGSTTIKIYLNGASEGGGAGSSNITISTDPPSGVPSDYDEWVIIPE